MAFKQFIGQQAKASSPKISILANGMIEFNEPAARKFALSRFNYALLYYDQDAHQIGIRFINNASEQGAVRIVKKPHAIAVPAVAFLEDHGLRKKSRTAYEMTYSGEHDMYIIQLSTRSRKSSKQRDSQSDRVENEKASAS
jgi:hypothetical protein